MAALMSPITGGEIRSKRQGASRAAASISIPDLVAFQRAFRKLGDAGGPFYEEGMREAGQILVGKIRAQGGSIAATALLEGVRGKGARARARIVVPHPGAKPMEFGRRMYWVGYRGRMVKTGRKVLHSPGQVARPFLGIKDGGHAIGQAREPIVQAFAKAIETTFAELVR